MSVEKAAHRALIRMVAWRLVGEIVCLPQYVMKAIIAVVTHGLVPISTWLHQIEMSVFMFELDAARRYKLLTGIDLGTAGGEAGRYAALDPMRNEAIQDAMYDQWKHERGREADTD